MDAKYVADILSGAVLQDYMQHDSEDGPSCIFCGAQPPGLAWSESDIKHRDNCPVLIATMYQVEEILNDRDISLSTIEIFPSNY